MKIITLSSKNQITIPKEAVEQLQLLNTRKLILEYKNKEIVLKPLKISIVEQTAGSLTKYIPKNKLGKSFKTIMEVAKIKAARELAKKYERSRIGY